MDTTPRAHADGTRNSGEVSRPRALGSAAKIRATKTRGPSRQQSKARNGLATSAGQTEGGTGGEIFARKLGSHDLPDLRARIARDPHALRGCGRPAKSSNSNATAP